MAGGAGISRETAPPILDITFGLSGRRLLSLQAWQPRAENQQRRCDRPKRTPEGKTIQKGTAHRSSYVGWVIVSNNAGSPRSTTARARFMAGPRSLGFSIGPSAYQPMLWASLA